jgi:hypothetical protein
MKAKDVKCKDCGGRGELQGSDHTNTEGPFYIEQTVQQLRNS